ncbi:MAG: hydroxyacid-oxoacid transhydrogenase [Micromonosporaceae bacterium]
MSETVFTWGAPPLKFGAGALDELGYDVAALGLGRVLIVTDPGVAATGIPARAAEMLKAAGVDVTIYDQAHVEPTDASLREAAAAGRAAGPFDGFVAIGGGSAIDTAKAVNLLTSNPGDLMDYVNPPVGEGRAPTEPLQPLVAVPTTAGTGSESTPVCVMDILGLRVKTGISHPRLRPVLSIVDPLLTLTLPPEVTAAAGMDVLCHALESYTARPYSAQARKSPEQRVAYCGANPISDIWAERALTLLARSFRRAVADGGDADARHDMMLAATFAGMGFGNAGVHIPHACGYPIAGMVRDYRPAGYPYGEPMVPHGQSVSLTAPAAFRFTFDTARHRHMHAADLLAPAAGAEAGAPPREWLPLALTTLMRDIGIPNGLAAVGYDERDVPALVAGAAKQQRLLNVAPLQVTTDDLERIFRDSFHNW